MKKINIKGAIVKNNNKFIYDWLEMDAVCPRDVITALETANGEDVEVIISSGGGDVYAGSEIYTALKEYKGHSVGSFGKIVGLAGSAASIAAMGCKKLAMSPTAQLMIHRASVSASGNTKTFENLSEVLESHDVAIANAYMLKTGKSQKELLAMMDKETYFNAKTALENGFIDEIMFDDELKLSASVGAFEISDKAIEEVRNYLAKQKTTENGEEQPQPISHKDIELKAQQEELKKLKIKIMKGMLK